MAAAETVRSGWVTGGPRLAEFERRFAAVCDAQHAVGVSSWTTGVLSPRIRAHEPLAAVVEHFRRVIAGAEASLLSGQHGLQIVRLLEQTQVALDASLAKLDYGREASSQHRVAL